MTFGEKLYELRKQRGMSQEALARELNVSRRAISRWELGEVAPDNPRTAMSALLDIPAETKEKEGRQIARNALVYNNCKPNIHYIAKTERRGSASRDACKAL